MSDIFSQVGKFGRGKLLALLLVVTFLSIISSYALATSFNNPLVDAADLGDKDLVEKLIKQGEIPDSKGDFNTTALMRAAFRGNTDIIKMLIENGAYVNASDVGGETALHLAAKNGHTDAVKALIYYGAYVDIPDKEQWTPLMRATMAKQTDAVKTLIEKGADVSAVNNINESVLVHAAIVGIPDIAALITGSQKAKKISLEQENMALSLAKRKNHDNVEKVIASFMESPQKEPKTEIAQNNKKEKEEEKASSSEPPIPQIKEPERIYKLGNDKELPVLPKKNAIIEESKKATPIEEPEVEQSKKSTPPASDKDIMTARPVLEPIEQQQIYQTKANAVLANENNQKKKLEQLNTPKVETKTVMNIPVSKSTIPLPKNTSSESNSTFYVQLGTFKDDHSAEVAWDKIISSNNDVLAKLDPNIIETTLSSAPGDVVYRLRAGTVPTKNDADITCKNLRARKIECYVVEVSNDFASLPTAKTKPSASAEPTKPVATISKSATEMPVAPEKPITFPEAIAATPETAPVKPAAFNGNYPKLQPETENIAPLDINPTPSTPAVEKPALPQIEAAQPMPAQPANAQAKKGWKLPSEQLEASASSNLPQTAPAPMPIAPPPAPTPTQTYPAAKNQPLSTPYQNTPADGKSRYSLEQSNVASINSPQTNSTLLNNNDDFAKNKDEIRSEIQEMTRENFFRSQGIEPPKRTKKEYDDFYKQVENSSKEPSVSEAILVPDETYFAGSSQPYKSPASSGTWLNISNLSDEVFANDYGMRMFKYDESLGNVQIIVSKPTPPATAVNMRVGPLLPDQANTLCDTVKSGGYACTVVGGGIAKRTPASTPALEPDSTQIAKPQDYWITLGTFASNAEAEYYWMFIKEDNNDILNQLKYDISTSTKSSELGNEAVKLRTGPFSTKQRATQLCNVMRYKNIACLVTD